MKKIKVLVVDDASFMIKAVSEILNSDPDIEVIGSAKNGQLAIEKIKELKPDVITLDVDMPIMDGLRATRHIMLECPVPIVMLSSLFANGAITFEALRLGVVDFLPKPSGAISQDIHTAKQQIIDRIKTAVSVDIGNIRRVKVNQMNENNKLDNYYAFQTLEYLLLIGTNLGGPNTSINIFSKLSSKLATAAVMMQEISPKMLDAFVKEFNKYTLWNIRVASDNAVLEAGVCYIASNEYSVTIVINDDVAQLKINKPVAKPLNQLFSSAANIFGAHTIGVLLTGIGNDGSEGFRDIKNNAGITLAQESNTCVYPNLTQCAIEQGLVDTILSDKQLPNGIENLIKEHTNV